MATFLAHIRIHPGREAEFEALARELWTATHLHEPEVRRYEYWRGAEPGSYYTIGSFADYLGFIAHQVSDHHTEPTAALRAVMSDLRLEWIEPVDGASADDLSPTNNTDLPADASDLANAYASRQPADVQPWWAPLRTG